MDKKAFAECLKRNRKKQNISIEELAEKTGITVDKLIEFESGDFVKIKAISGLVSIYLINIMI